MTDLVDDLVDDAVTAPSGLRRGEQVLALRVRAREQLTDDVVRLTLAAPDGEPLPRWEPGAHVDLVLGPDLVRQYSLCGDPADACAWQVAVQRAPDGGRGGSRVVVDEVAVGMRLEVRGPRNAFPLRPAARYLFVAGGIGITPLLPMLARADALGADWQLVYGGRSRSAMPFLAELARYGGRVRVLPQDETGLLPVADLLGRPWPGTLVYCCGPAPLLAAVEATMVAAGWPEDALSVERFAPAGPQAAPPGGAGRRGGRGGRGGGGGLDTAFEVELASSGRVVAVPPDRTVLQALQDAGVPVLSSCRGGTCGTCEVGVLDGVVDHRDRLLTEAERAAHDTMFVCVSRAAGPRLVLDL
jgi:ferredoxin-NADP reductase